MRRIIWVTLFSLFATALVVGQGIDFFHGTWQEALEKASQENKLIFVDAYTTWCGPCRRMSANVFPRQDVGDFYNANFINMKLDMEREEGLKFRQKYSVGSFPTYFWIDYNGEVVHTAKGSRMPADFIALGEAAAKKYDGSAQFRTLYEEGSRDYDVIYNYVVELNRSGKSSLRVANEYIRSQEDMTTPENLKFIAAATTQVDSKPFELLEEFKDRIAKIEGVEKVNNIIRAACQMTAERAAMYESTDLLSQAESAMERHLPKEADLFSTVAHMDYAATLIKPDEDLKYTKVYLKKYVDDQPETLESIGVTVIRYFSGHPELVAVGEKAAEKAQEGNPNEENTIVYATLIYVGGDKERALKVLDNAIDAARENEQPARNLISLRKRFAST